MNVAIAGLDRYDFECLINHSMSELGRGGVGPMRYDAKVNRSDERPGKVSRRSKALLAAVGAIAILLTMWGNAQRYGWSQGVLIATTVTVPIAVVLYYIILRRWSR